MSNQYRQGDVFLEEISEIPADVKVAVEDRRGIVLAEGEVTGHHHRFGPQFRTVKMYTNDEGSRFINVMGTGTPRVRELSKALNDDITQVNPLPPAVRELLRNEALDLGAVPLQHEEHGELVLPPGNYKMDGGVQREYSPGAIQNVAD